MLGKALDSGGTSSPEKRECGACPKASTLALGQALYDNTSRVGATV